MLFTDASAALVAALALGATSAEATFRMNTRPLAFTRVDPLVNPKAVSGHVHNIRGGSLFRDIVDSTEDMLKAKCTTMDINPDKSNYWTPALYYINPNGTYSHMYSDVIVYYANAAGKPNAFPNGLRMLTGLPTKRDIGSMRSQGISWAVNAHMTERNPPEVYNTKFMPNGSNVDEAPYRVSAHAFFPSCGLANGTLDSEDHFSHMAWPVGEGGHKQWIQIGNSPNCPASHPLKYPEIHVETFWKLTDWQRQNWRKGKANLVLSNGDLTGTTFHADFVNGWDGDILQKALDDQTCLNQDADQCPPLQEHKNNNMDDCRWQGQLVDEDVGLWTPISKLPGCNPLWGWDGPVDKPDAKGDQCTPTPGYVSPNLMLDIGGGNYLPQIVQHYNGNLSSLGGCNTPHLCPVWSEWALTRKKENVTYVQRGTQAEVEANVVQNEKNKRMVIPGMQNDNHYTAIKPTKTYGAGKTLAPSNIITITDATDYFCPKTDPVKQPYGMPCGPSGTYASPGAFLPKTTTPGAAAATGGAAVGAAPQAAGSKPTDTSKTKRSRSPL